MRLLALQQRGTWVYQLWAGANKARPSTSPLFSLCIKKIETKKEFDRFPVRIFLKQEVTLSLTFVNEVDTIVSRKNEKVDFGFLSTPKKPPKACLPNIER